MKKILIVQGGGRANGNTAQLAKAFMKGTQEAGHEVELVSLNNVQVNGCIGCNACTKACPQGLNVMQYIAYAQRGEYKKCACRYGKPCVQKDGFNSLVPKILSADLIVFASPLYFWTISSKLKAFIERFYCIAQPDDNPPLGRYERYPVHDSALLMTAADNFFWTFQQAASYYRFAVVDYIGFRDKGMLLAGGCGDTNGKPQIEKTDALQRAYQFGKTIYENE